MRAAAARVIRGPARPGRKTKHLIPHLHRGDIAIIDHPDMDAVCAGNLLQQRPAAVINASPSLSGRYPATGPSMLLSAGLPVFECAGTDLLDRVADGEPLEVSATGDVVLNGTCLAKAAPLTQERLQSALETARQHVSVEMEAFVRNTLSYLTEEWPLLFEESPLPSLRTRIQGRHVLIVVRGEGYREDLQAILPYARDRRLRPVLIGVDGGADALLEAGLRPHVILGDMDSVSDAALRCGAEILVHGYPRQNGTASSAPGLERVKGLGVKAQVLHALGTSEDVAMILAERLGARLIVAVGTHFSLQEFLDKGRKGMSSTFLARLKVGSILVDAKGVSRLYQRGIGWQQVAWIVLAAMVLVLVILFVSPAARAFLDLIAVKMRLWLRQW